ncbi:MAG: tetratricopeptide repeat protein [Desulfobacteraceae bacterium]|nr:MAG: tetratricopeptide repeat protein [Desulfobacteraceae bacterium]
MPENNFQVLFDQAAAKQSNGDLEAVQNLYRELLVRDPLNLEALYCLGVIQLSTGQPGAAVAAFQKALALKPENPAILNNLALAYKGVRNFSSARSSLEQALTLEPGAVRVRFNLANLLRETGHEPEAIEQYLRVIAEDPRDAAAYKNLSLAYLHLGLLTEALRACRSALALQPQQAGLYYNRGLIAMAAGDWIGASLDFLQAQQLDPCSAEACLNLGVVRQKLGDLKQAEFWFKKTLELQPHRAEAFYNLGLLYEQTHDLDKELATQSRALAACPDRIQTWIGALRAFSKTVDWPRLNRLLDRIVAYPFSEKEEDLLSTALYLLHAFPLSDSLLFEKHARWGDFALRKYGRSPADRPFDFRSLKQRSSKIRIGYVSPDFCRHSVGWFFNNLITGHDRERFEIYIYAVTPNQDDLTAAVAQDADAFKTIPEGNTRGFAETIYGDRIQILVDLAGHTRHHRLDVFAARPAPVQVTAFGYPNGTGLATMDYRISDSEAESPSSRMTYREKLVLLSRFFLPLGPLACAPHPMTRSQYGLPATGVVLTSFNRPGKLRPEVLRLWKRILEQCPQASLALGCPHAARSDLQANLLAHFPAPVRSRIFFLERAQNEEEHRARYRLTDLALDSFPYSGTATSYEALFMNVPVITLPGDRHVQRTTYSLLKHLGLEETLARSEQDYVEKVVALIRSPDSLRDLKTKLRDALQKALADRIGYVRELEQAYEIMWRRYQHGQPPREIRFEKNSS